MLLDLSHLVLEGNMTGQTNCLSCSNVLPLTKPTLALHFSVCFHLTSLFSFVYKVLFILEGLVLVCKEESLQPAISNRKLHLSHWIKYSPSTVISLILFHIRVPQRIQAYSHMYTISRTYTMPIIPSGSSGFHLIRLLF